MSKFITLEHAREMKDLYLKEREVILVPEHRGKNIIAISETFNAADLKKLLDQPDCTSLRVYYGMNVELKIHAILVAVNSKDEDILHLILEEATRCPPICPPPGL